MVSVHAMSEAANEQSHALDKPGSAGAKTLRRSTVVAVVIVTLAVFIMFKGWLQLAAFPQFTVFHATFSFVVYLVTAFLIFGQFLYRHMLSYLLLAAAFLFSALVTIPFLLSFPGAISRGTIIGGPQSAIWVWHLWHILFPALIGAGALSRKFISTPVAHLGRAVGASIFLVVLSMSGIVLAVTVFHDALPVLYGESGRPLTPAFYSVGAVAAVVTTAALIMVLPRALNRSILHIWIAMVLLALMADVGASLSAYARYTVGWYFGRVEAMLASGLLLVVFLAETTRLYRELEEKARALAVANAKKDRLLAELSRREQEFEALAELAPDIIARMDRKQCIRYVNRAIERLTGKARETFIGRSLAELGLPQAELALRNRMVRQVFETGQEQELEHTHILPNETRYFHARLAPEFGPDGDVVSILVMERDITELKHAQLALEKLSQQDPLTGVANRRFLAQFVERVWRREARHRHSVALIMADIDHFKAYNDRYGHPQGDVCLRQVAEALKEQLRRPDDLVARYGGEEFLIVLPEMTLAAAVEIAQRMCMVVKALGLAHEASPIAPVVTISLGVSAGPADLHTYSEMLEAADQALYRAKRGGRDRVESVLPESP
jgi:diguanylate cyclase (GGDEF)-like protein/PAS domain S-box-containing protein